MGDRGVAALHSAVRYRVLGVEYIDRRCACLPFNVVATDA